jgi:TRAP transporter TAXI family solute receptor
VSLFVGVALLAAGLGFFTYHRLTRPVVLTVAAGSIDGEGVRIMSAIASRFAANKAPIRLKVVDAGSAIGAAEALSSGKADLAIVRSDIGNLSNARSVVLVTHFVVLLIAPPGSPVKDVGDLKNRTLGVIGEQVNGHIVEILRKEFDLPRMQTKDLKPEEVRQAIQSKHIHALLAVAPISDRYIAALRSFVPANEKRHPIMIAIDSAEAIAVSAKAFESYELPKGTFKGAPPIPDEDLTTLRVPVHLAVRQDLDNDTVNALTKAVMESRRDLVADFPLASQISAPNTDKDANIPVHPGAKLFFDGEEKTIFDKYGDQFFYATLVLGSLTSALAAAWKFIIGGSEAPGGRLVDRLNDLSVRIRSSRNKDELDAIEEEIDAILRTELNGLQSRETALNMAAARLERLIHLQACNLSGGANAGGAGG